MGTDRTGITAARAAPHAGGYGITVGPHYSFVTRKLKLRDSGRFELIPALDRIQPAADWNARQGGCFRSRLANLQANEVEQAAKQIVRIIEDTRDSPIEMAMTVKTLRGVAEEQGAKVRSFVWAELNRTPTLSHEELRALMLVYPAQTHARIPDVPAEPNSVEQMIRQLSNLGLFRDIGDVRKARWASTLHAELAQHLCLPTPGSTIEISARDRMVTTCMLLSINGMEGIRLFVEADKLIIGTPSRAGQIKRMCLKRLQGVNKPAVLAMVGLAAAKNKIAGALGSNMDAVCGVLRRAIMVQRLWKNCATNTAEFRDRLVGLSMELNQLDLDRTAAFQEVSRKGHGEGQLIAQCVDRMWSKRMPPPCACGLTRGDCGYGAASEHQSMSSRGTRASSGPGLT